ncbi:hypothetical protein E5K02_10270 [Hymenobacter metallicola]|uniref:Uncharacterized protein n=1 Tax=Hymenobacter metallicola TaxID=2563114 RepID=A0A4Z0QKN4_9BACT|nr:hypothetical protein E5K02_10270 [Hymenobacter metallicola]
MKEPAKLMTQADINASAPIIASFIFPGQEVAEYSSVELTEISEAISIVHLRRPDLARVMRRFFNDMKAGKVLRETNALNPPQGAPVGCAGCAGKEVYGE